LIVIDVFCP
jgi:hypothetical protein